MLTYIRILFKYIFCDWTCAPEVEARGAQPLDSQGISRKFTLKFYKDIWPWKQVIKALP